jgi:hypothetical protein
MAEEAMSSRDCQGHGAELSQEAVPLSNREALLGAGNTREELRKAYQVIGGEHDGHGDRVNDPS